MNPIIIGFMATHIKIVAALHIAIGVIVTLGAAWLAYTFNALATFIEFFTHSNDRLGALPFLAVILLLGGSALFLISMPGLIGGVGILLGKSWGRNVLIVVCFCELVEFPVGTTLGVYSLWVLLSKETKLIVSPPYPYR